MGNIAYFRHPKHTIIFTFPIVFKARFKRRTLHVPNLMSLLGTLFHVWNGYDLEVLFWLRHTNTTRSTSIQLGNFACAISNAYITNVYFTSKILRRKQLRSMSESAVELIYLLLTSHNLIKLFILGGFTEEHPCIESFWRVVSQFTDTQKRQLLKFVTSCSRPPLLGFKVGSVKNIFIQETLILPVNFNSWVWLQVSLAWARDPIEPSTWSVVNFKYGHVILVTGYLRFFQPLGM